MPLKTDPNTPTIAIKSILSFFFTTYSWNIKEKIW
jgi:hypothetical protein